MSGVRTFRDVLFMLTFFSVAPRSQVLTRQSFVDRAGPPVHHNFDAHKFAWILRFPLQPAEQFCLGQMLLDLANCTVTHDMLPCLQSLARPIAKLCMPRSGYTWLMA